ncbi:phospholipase D-like domain-containing protein [Lysinibacillus xylanilyticus]|uniref:phospholipase D-like domain-containing protein n=1 Tax=Lysinibacillus xylanilyticus TaxID=582475 RepID=UPI003CFBEBE5
MREEIPFHEGKVVFFKESNFWDELLTRVSGDTDTIYIATYNFNFNQYPSSFYEKLADLANVGVDVRLVYANMTYANEDNLNVEEVFKNFVLCAQLESNHSKLFITDNFAFVGSANFSFGSNKNYESGVIFENKNIVEKINKYYCNVLLNKSEFRNVPQIWDSLDALKNTLHIVKDLKKYKIEDLYTDEVRERIPELRYLDNIEEDLKGLGFSPPKSFDWFGLYMEIYDDNTISEEQFSVFTYYLNYLQDYLIQAIKFINNQYKTIGRLETLKRAKVIEE